MRSTEFTELVKSTIKSMYEDYAERLMSGVTVDNQRQLIIWKPSKLKESIFEILGTLSEILRADYCCWPRQVDNDKFAIVYKYRQKPFQSRAKTFYGSIKEREDFYRVTGIISAMSSEERLRLRRLEVVLEETSPISSSVLSYNNWLVGYAVQNQVEAVVNPELLRKVKSIILAEALK